MRSRHSRTPTPHRTAHLSSRLHPSSSLVPLPSLTPPSPFPLLPPFRTLPLPRPAPTPHHQAQRRLVPSRLRLNRCWVGNGAIAIWDWERGLRRRSQARRQRPWRGTARACQFRRRRHRWDWACRGRASPRRRGHHWLRRSTRRLDLTLEVSQAIPLGSEPLSLLPRSPFLCRPRRFLRCLARRRAAALDWARFRRSRGRIYYIDFCSSDPAAYPCTQGLVYEEHIHLYSITDAIAEKRVRVRVE
jgi:hypothetical protein